MCYLAENHYDNQVDDGSSNRSDDAGCEPDDVILILVQQRPNNDTVNNHPKHCCQDKDQLEIINQRQI